MTEEENIENIETLNQNQNETFNHEINTEDELMKEDVINDLDSVVTKTFDGKEEKGLTIKYDEVNSILTKDKPCFTFYVREAQKSNKKGIKSYYVYPVEGSTNLENYKSDKFQVWRRYSDFVWLHTMLGIENVGCIIPPIPEKDMTTTYDKFLSQDTKGVLEYRQRYFLK
jgi:hypothetical protein